MARPLLVCYLWLLHHFGVVFFLCSNNYLQIRFSCLEKGIYFKELLGEKSLSLSPSLAPPLSLLLPLFLPLSLSPSFSLFPFFPHTLTMHTFICCVFKYKQKLLLMSQRPKLGIRRVLMKMNWKKRNMKTTNLKWR